MYRTVAQLDALTQLLASWFPGYFTRVQLPETSVQGRPVHALRMRAGGAGDRRGVLVVGGTHARELMNPDAIVELAVDLLVSHANGTDIVYGGRRWSVSEVRLILETLDLWLVPCTNPDGRVHAMTVDRMWRKNRAVNAGTACVGVDLNRNADMLWGVTQGQTSCSPCSDVYCGPSAFSEPETRNVKHLLDTCRIDTFADVHSYSELVLWPWGHAPAQTHDPTQRFTTLPTGTCTTIGPSGYQEHIEALDLQRHQTVGQRVVEAIAAVRGRTYANQAGVVLYPVTGAQSDYVYSRHIADPGLRKTYGFTLETGPWMGSVEESFQPADPEPAKTDAKSGLIALMQQTICAIELIGMRFFSSGTEIDSLRGVRDELLATTEAGREWILLFQRVQQPLLGELLGDQELLSEAAALVRKAGVGSDDAQIRLSDEDVERAVRISRTLSKRTASPGIRRDLQSVERHLHRVRGLSVADVVTELMTHPPGSARPPKRT
jgi:murein tripeptide amidase MpaA